MNGWLRPVCVCCAVTCATVTAQRPPSPDDLTSHPFFITKTWVVGGAGDWGYMTMDPVARQLLIAHGPTVQVVDVASGSLAGTVTGLREAHSIALDSAGELGYITDGPADQVKIFDRRTFEVIAAIPTGPAPRSLALDPQTGLLFVVGSQPASERDEVEARSASHSSAPKTSARPTLNSTITVIDADARKQLAQIILSGSLGAAEADGNGHVFVTLSDSKQLVRLDAPAVSSFLQRTLISSRSAQTPPTKSEERGLVLDWSAGSLQPPPAEARPRVFSVGSSCDQPRALAVDSAHARIFAACNNMKMVVINDDNGTVITTVPIGPGADGIAYDAGRGLIFSANGGGDGTLTIIHQDVTDTYSVVQILPTRQGARTVAVNSSTGEVYLVAVLYGAELNGQAPNGTPIKMSAVDSSFQVLVIGN